MHGVLITFQSAEALDELIEANREFAEMIVDQPGFIRKTWLRDGTTLGGFYEFVDAPTAQSYAQGDIVAGIRTTPGYSDVEVRVFELFDGVRALTRIPSRTTASTAITA